MKFNNIKMIINEVVKNRYEFDENNNIGVKLLSYASEEIGYKDVVRLRRSGHNNSWKTIIIVEIGSEKIKDEFKKVITWVALVKELLQGDEGVDLYLFLAFNNQISKEECLRIESSEYFCRKYVLLPEENTKEFLNRTFLQKIGNNYESIDGEDPLEIAFSKTASKFDWLTPDMIDIWKKAFSELSGIELSDVLLNEGGQ